MQAQARELARVALDANDSDLLLAVAFLKAVERCANSPGKYPETEKRLIEVARITGQPRSRETAEALKRKLHELL